MALTGRPTHVAAETRFAYHPGPYILDSGIYWTETALGRESARISPYPALRSPSVMCLQGPLTPSPTSVGSRMSSPLAQAMWTGPVSLLHLLSNAGEVHSWPSTLVAEMDLGQQYLSPPSSRKRRFMGECLPSWGFRFSHLRVLGAQRRTFHFCWQPHLGTSNQLVLKQNQKNRVDWNSIVTAQETKSPMELQFKRSSSEPIC